MDRIYRMKSRIPVARSNSKHTRMCFYPVNPVHPVQIFSFVTGFAISKSNRVMKADYFAVK